MQNKAGAEDGSIKVGNSGSRIKSVEAGAARTGPALPESPDSGDDLVHALEDSGYPVGGAKELFIQRPDDPSVAPDGTTANSGKTRMGRPVPARRAPTQHSCRGSQRRISNLADPFSNII